MITYEKLFEILKDKGYNKNWLRNNGIHALTVSKLIKNENVNITTINQLCNLLECEPCDILTYTKDKGE
ncbi:MAG: helix-turn-helix transcriptional regulator [Lachnospiraceae bacterium]|nr:helix-turn-helix transcriptional regulator [Lachnospiraceae bacterium]